MLKDVKNRKDRVLRAELPPASSRRTYTKPVVLGAEHPINAYRPTRAQGPERPHPVTVRPSVTRGRRWYRKKQQDKKLCIKDEQGLRR